MNIAELLLTEFDQELESTRKTLERVPEDMFTWKPHTKSFDLISLATHLANIASWGTLTMTADEFDYAPPGAPPYKEPPAESRADLLTKLANGAGEFRGALQGASNEKLMEPWTLLAGGKPVFTMPRYSVLRGMILNHCVHHRAQLGVYLRLLNVPVPSVYGPTADEAS
ncbi:MAG: DinB family protein [Bryobacterales bacterium]|nr:DinB family protein [Bryobacterales bacterium]